LRARILRGVFDGGILGRSLRAACKQHNQRTG
jgi:hypothetical protein